VISIGRLGNATAAADYYLQRQAGCQADYYTGIGERRGAWLGRGATALGLVGELTSRDDETFRGLLAGRHPDGTVLAAPVLRVDPRGRLDARPLVTAVRGANPARLGEPWPAFDALARQVDRSPLAFVTVRADAALAIATAAGLDARTVYGDVGLSLDDALAHLDERIDVRRPGYDVVFSAPKSVSVVYGLGDDDTSREAREAHASAVQQAMDYLELFVARSAQGHHGTDAQPRGWPPTGWSQLLSSTAPAEPTTRSCPGVRRAARCGRGQRSRLPGGAAAGWDRLSASGPKVRRSRGH